MYITTYYYILLYILLHITIYTFIHFKTFRSCSWCGHKIGGLFYFYHIYNNIIIPNPTPIIDKRFGNIMNATNFMYQYSKKDLISTNSYLNNIFNNDEYEEEELVLCKHKYVHLPSLALDDTE